MKLISILVFFSASSVALAQNIEICEDNTTIDISGTCVIAQNTNIDPDLYTFRMYLTLKLTGSSSKEIKVSRLRLIEAPGISEYMAWGTSILVGASYPNSFFAPYNLWTSPDYFTFDTLTEGILGLYYDATENHYAKNRYYIQEYFPNTDSTSTLDSIDVEFGSPLSISEKIQPSIHLFPNPAINLVNINIENLDGNASISIYDIAGKVVLETEIKNGKNQLNVEFLNAGVYFYAIRNSKGIIESKKLLIQ